MLTIYDPMLAAVINIAARKAPDPRWSTRSKTWQFVNALVRTGGVSHVFQDPWWFCGQIPAAPTLDHGTVGG